MKTVSRLQTARHALRLGAISVLASLSIPNSAGAQSMQSLVQSGEDLIALFDAEEAKSPMCKGYEGKIVTPTAFSTLVQRLSGPSPKGEFETTAQYQARLAATSASVPTSPVVVTIPVDRDYLSYNADNSLMLVQAGAFGDGEFSDVVDVQLTANYFGLIPKGIPEGIKVAHSRSERLVRTRTMRSGLGIDVKVSDIDRFSNGFYIASPKLFTFAKRDDSPVMFFKAAPARAQSLKQTVRIALAVVPKAPYVFRAEQPAAVPTLRNPVQYEDKLTAIYVDAKCALVLDAQSRVLASMDAGS